MAETVTYKDIKDALSHIRREIEILEDLFGYLNGSEEVKFIRHWPHELHMLGTPPVDDACEDSPDGRSR